MRSFRIIDSVRRDGIQHEGALGLRTVRENGADKKDAKPQRDRPVRLVQHTEPQRGSFPSQPRPPARPARTAGMNTRTCIHTHAYRHTQPQPVQAKTPEPAGSLRQPSGHGAERHPRGSPLPTSAGRPPPCPVRQGKFLQYGGRRLPQETDGARRRGQAGGAPLPERPPAIGRTGRPPHTSLPRRHHHVVDN